MIMVTQTLRAGSAEAIAKGVRSSHTRAAARIQARDTAPHWVTGAESAVYCDPEGLQVRP
jgi:hypothetical protein